MRSSGYSQMEQSLNGYLRLRIEDFKVSSSNHGGCVPAATAKWSRALRSKGSAATGSPKGPKRTI
jgi:hypothetical protein